MGGRMAGIMAFSMAFWVGEGERLAKKRGAERRRVGKLGELREV
jgi:hypothetical protein